MFNLNPWTWMPPSTIDHHPRLEHTQMFQICFKHFQTRFEHHRLTPTWWFCDETHNIGSTHAPAGGTVSWAMRFLPRPLAAGLPWAMCRILIRVCRQIYSSQCVAQAAMMQSERASCVRRTKGSRSELICTKVTGSGTFFRYRFR